MASTFLGFLQLNDTCGILSSGHPVVWVELPCGLVNIISVLREAAALPGRKAAQVCCCCLPGTRYLRMRIFPLSLPGPQIWVPFSHRPCSHLPISALMECTRILEYPFPIRIICFLIDRQQCVIGKSTT